MKPLLLYSCLLAILLQVILASTSRNKPATLTGKGPGTKKKAPVKSSRKKRGGKPAKVGVKEDKSQFLSAILPKTLVELVIGYFEDDIYSVLVSTHDWSLQDEPEIAVDSSRLYVMTMYGGLKGLNHSLANLEKSEQHCIKFGDPQWLGYTDFTSSHDGRCISFSHEYRESSELEEQDEESTKWFTLDSGLEGEKPKRVEFAGENSSWGRLSRDGQVLCSYNGKTQATRIYRIVEEAGKTPTALFKFAFNGHAGAVSGKSNRVMIKREDWFEVYDIDKNTSKLVRQIKTTQFVTICALNEDGTEAAFVGNDELRVMKVDKVAGGKADQSASVSVNVPDSLELIIKLVYSSSGKLHVLYYGGSVSLFDPLTKALVPIEVPQEGQVAIKTAISPNANYIAILQRAGEEEKSKKTVYKTIVRRKPGGPEWMRIFGYETGKEAAK